MQTTVPATTNLHSRTIYIKIILYLIRVFGGLLSASEKQKTVFRTDTVEKKNLFDRYNTHAYIGTLSPRPDCTHNNICMIIQYTVAAMVGLHDVACISFYVYIRQQYYYNMRTMSRIGERPLCTMSREECNDDIISYAYDIVLKIKYYTVMQLFNIIHLSTMLQ